MTFWHTLKPPGNAGNANLPSGLVPPGNAAIIPDPVLWAQSQLGFTPDPVQSEILRSPAARLMLCCTRQFGKSTITAIKALHHAWTHPDSLVLAAAPTARQSGEWIQKSKFLLGKLGARVRSDGHNRLSLVLANGSRLVGLPGVPDNVRGFSKASLILIDEAAFVPDELYQALNPMLAVSGGGLWLMSTPAAQLGFFYEEWSRLEEPQAERTLPDTIAGWKRFQVTAEQCPRIPPEFLAEQRILLGDSVFRREYMCEFVAAGTQIIDREMLDGAIDDELAPFNGGGAIWR